MAEKFEYTREWTDANAFPMLGFTKSWENPEDYPTIELDETQVRKDMQSLHDEVKDYINTKLIPAVLAEDATEEARAAAESMRASAEELRASSEQARAEAEQNRASAEQERESAENVRDAAEQTREAAEKARADETSGIVARATEQANLASSAAASAGNSAEAAANSKSAAASSASSAAGSAAAASTSEAKAKASETAAKESETTAKSEADRAKSEADRAAGIVGGDYATKADLAAHTEDAGIHVTAEEKATWNAKADAPFKPEGKSYLTFSSPNSFTLKVNDTIKHWDGTLEYFASDRTWSAWDGTTTLSSVDNDGEHVLYLRGSGNTVITGGSEDSNWVLTGSDIACKGNIENLLDYATVESGAHPTMASSCYDNMFYGCTGLTQAPTLPATKLTASCYYHMFEGCTSLTQAPALPATTLAESCYSGMLSGCTSIVQAPALPATTLATYCYGFMFKNCTSLTQAPALPATTLADYCYYYMFYGCRGLIQAPSLPVTTLSKGCYKSMFDGCISLIQAPSLPATTLADNCYDNMFYGCTGLTQAPSLPATTLARSCYYHMFSGCTSLAQASALPATTLAPYCYYGMFYDCTSLKLSSTQTDEYTQEYRIPSSGTGLTATDALTDMFTSTGGTFTGTPSINTTYYLSSDNMVARETEIATLKGYIKFMIDAAAPKSVTVTLAAASWDSTAKTQTVTVTGVKASEAAQMITPTPALASQTAYYDAGILCTGQAADSLTFTCKTVPTADLTVYVVIQEVAQG